MNYKESQLEYLTLRIETLEKIINDLEKENKYLKEKISRFKTLPFIRNRFNLEEKNRILKIKTSHENKNNKHTSKTHK